MLHVHDRWRWRLIVAIAPVAWGSTYYVTRRYLPSDAALWAPTIRALPAGLLLLLVARRLPTGAWWWRSAVLGVLNAGLFFGLVYLAAQRLPTSVASMIMANAPLTIMLAAWLAAAERPRVTAVAGALVGIAGAGLMLWGGTDGIDATGVAASTAALAISSVGFVLARRWGAEPGAPHVIASTAWQLLAAGMLLIPVAGVVSGAPPDVGVAGVIGFAYLAVVGTALGFVCWFAGIFRLPAAEVGLIGLLNPVTGVLLGTLAAGENLSARQVVGVVLVLAGVLVGQDRRSQPRPALPEPEPVVGVVRPVVESSVG